MTGSRSRRIPVVAFAGLTIVDVVAVVAAQPLYPADRFDRAAAIVFTAARGAGLWIRGASR